MWSVGGCFFSKDRRLADGFAAHAFQVRVGRIYFSTMLQPRPSAVLSQQPTRTTCASELQAMNMPPSRLIMRPKLLAQLNHEHSEFLLLPINQPSLSLHNKTKPHTEMRFLVSPPCPCPEPPLRCLVSKLTSLSQPHLPSRESPSFSLRLAHDLVHTSALAGDILCNALENVSFPCLPSHKKNIGHVLVTRSSCAVTKHALCCLPSNAARVSFSEHAEFAQTACQLLHSILL